jgi:hypothetical protein
VSAFNHVTDYSTNLDNYRYCSGGDPLATCSYDNTRAPSAFHLTRNSKASLSYNNGIAKLRIDSLEVDTTHKPWPCVSQSYSCGTSGGGGCQSGKVCQAGPSTASCCVTDADCGAVACNGGPQHDTACTNDASCEKIDGSKHWTAVFRGNQASFVTGQPLPIPFLLRGDDETGCMMACDFTIETAGSTAIGTVNSNGLTCQMSGDCMMVPTFHHVEIIDPDGQVMAIPAWGTAQIVEGFPMTKGDPAKVGDACLTVVPKPGDCL